jgi:hypothetical protein
MIFKEGVRYNKHKLLEFVSEEDLRGFESPGVFILDHMQTILQ